MFHLSLQTGLGRPYSVARHMFFRPSQNYVQLSCHHCSRRDQSQMSERRPKVLSHHIHCKMAIQIELHWLDATKVIGPCWNAEATHVEILGAAVEPWAPAGIGWSQARFVVVQSDWQPADRSSFVSLTASHVNQTTKLGNFGVIWCLQLVPCLR